MKITTISYGIAIIIISAIIHYLTLAGIANCNSMSGIVSTYTSKDYALGCEILSNTKIGAIAGEVSGVVLIILGIFQKPKIK